MKQISKSAAKNRKSRAEVTKLYSDRTGFYVKYRPDYPAEIVWLLRTELGFSKKHVVVDVGSGTGLLAKLFLKNGNPVYGVEPNGPMRRAGEKVLAKKFPAFVSTDGTAEKTTLKDAQADIIVVGQAFHWFDHAKTQLEFKRILKPKAYVVLIWNEPRSYTPFERHYKQLLNKFPIKYPPAGKTLDHKLLNFFFGKGGVKFRLFENVQALDFKGLKGNLLSMSYAPNPKHPRFKPMFAAMKELFDYYQIRGKIKITYDTKVYYGRLP